VLSCPLSSPYASIILSSMITCGGERVMKHMDTLYLVQIDQASTRAGMINGARSTTPRKACSNPEEVLTEVVLNRLEILSYPL
jgi:hypothetical protein